MSRTELKNGTILGFPDGRSYEILGLIGAGGSALLYEAREIGSELYAAIKEIYPADGYLRVNGEIVPDGAASVYQARVAALAKRKEMLRIQEAAFGQSASRKNYQVIPILSPVYEQADIHFPDGAVYQKVKNSYALMESLTEKGVTAGRYTRGWRTAEDKETEKLNAQLTKKFEELFGGIWSEAEEAKPQAIDSPLEETQAADSQAGTLSLDNVVKIMHTVLNAYAALHEDGFIHGDCQADNIFLLGTRATEGKEFAGTAYIIDFGAARKLTNGQHTEIIADEIFSTDGYRAPELLTREENFRMTPACDVWSLGFLMLELLTGKAEAFAELGEEEMTEFLMLHPREKLLTDARAQYLGCNAAVKYGLNHILKRALANDPADRYQNAGEMRRALLLFDRCRRLDLSEGVTTEHLWEAAVRYFEKNPQLFEIEHKPKLAQHLYINRLEIYGQLSGEEPEPIQELLRRLTAKNLYLQAPGGGGKSFAVSGLFRDYLENGKRIPLYLDLIGFTETLLQDARSYERALVRLLARQYLGTDDIRVCEEIEALFAGGKTGEEPEGPEVSVKEQSRKESAGQFFLILDNLHKVSEKVYSAAIAAINHADSTYQSVWMIVSGREENPGGGDRLEGQLCGDMRSIPPLGIVKKNGVRILPLTEEHIFEAITESVNRELTEQEVHNIRQQQTTLQLPLFLMRYLEILNVGGRYAARRASSEREAIVNMLRDMVDRMEGIVGFDVLPNSAAELLRLYFQEYEYEDTGRKVHEVLEKYLPVIGYRYVMEGQSGYTIKEIQQWLGEYYGRRIVDDAAVSEILDICVRRLAVLVPGAEESYYFAHDCYMDYFACILIAQRIQAALVEEEPGLLGKINHEWPKRLVPMWHALLRERMGEGRITQEWDVSMWSEDLYRILNENREVAKDKACYLPRNVIVSLRGWPCEWTEEDLIWWLRLGAELGDALVQTWLASAWIYGDHEMPAQPGRGMRWLYKAAKAGLPFAQSEWGAMLYWKKEEEEGLKWIRKAAEAGDLYGQVRLAEILLQKGEEEEHKKWLEKLGGMECWEQLLEDVKEHDFLGRWMYESD